MRSPWGHRAFLTGTASTAPEASEHIKSLPGSNGERIGAEELHFYSQWVVRCPRKRPLNETHRKCRSKRWNRPKSVSVSHLTKHRLIKRLQRLLSETRLQACSCKRSLPPKISRLLPGSGSDSGYTSPVEPQSNRSLFLLHHLDMD